MQDFEKLDVTIEEGAGIIVRRYARPGAPRLLLSHGNGFAMGGYRKFWELLLPDFELCLFDLRNHGMNPLGPIEGHSIAAMARDHIAIQDSIAHAFGPRQTIGLFHSIASISAIYAAQEFDAVWDTLVLFDPPLIAPPGNPLREMNEKLDAMLAGFARTRPHRFASVEDLAAQLAQKAGRTWVQGAARDMAEATTRPGEGGGVELSCPGEYEARIYEGNPAFGSYAAMAALRQPTFLICADAKAPRAMAPAFSGPEAARAHGLPCVSVANTTHLLQIEQPEIVAQHVRDFIGNVAAG